MERSVKPDLFLHKVNRNHKKIAKERLHFFAFDQEDLIIISAHLQNALTTLAHMVYQSSTRRFALQTERLNWQGLEKGQGVRCTTALHFEGVKKVRQRGFDFSHQDQVFHLLSISFEVTESPAGLVTLHFSEKAAIQIEVECLEAQMKDLGPFHVAAQQPSQGS